LGLYEFLLRALNTYVVFQTLRTGQQSMGP